MKHRHTKQAYMEYRLDQKVKDRDLAIETVTRVHSRETRCKGPDLRRRKTKLRNVGTSHALSGNREGVNRMTWLGGFPKKLRFEVMLKIC